MELLITKKPEEVTVQEEDVAQGIVVENVVVGVVSCVAGQVAH